MKGDLGTLRKICKYASKVMLAGTIVFCCCIAITVFLGVASLFWDGATDFLLWWIRTTYGIDSDTVSLPAYFYTLLFLILGSITTAMVYKLMMSVREGDSPFTAENASRMKIVSKAFLVATVPFAALQYASQNNIPLAVYICLGCILVSVVLYCLAIVFNYGAELQSLSDGTL